jgi:hypothetical protein
MRSVVRAPAPAATSGPNNRSHSGPLAPLVASLNRRAAATGVPNIAPSVPANANPAHWGAPSRGQSRAPTNTASPMVMPMIGFSGPRLTPKASVTMSASATPGSTAAGNGGSARPTVAGSGPACPGTNVTISPVRMPATVSIAIVQAGPVPSMPIASGTWSQSTPWMAPANAVNAMSATLDRAPTTTAGTTTGSRGRQCALPVAGSGEVVTSSSWRLASSRRGPPCQCRPVSAGKTAGSSFPGW